MMTSSKWKINVIFLVENCLSYNISKFGLNWTNGLSDTKQNYDLTFDLHLHNQRWPHMNLMFLCDLIVWSHSICTRNLGNLWWMVMKIWMIMWKHKMAPRWRHGWVIRLKRLLYPFLIRAKILWKFENDCSFRFWDILNTKFIQRGKKRFVKTSLRAINRRSRDRIGRNLVSEYFEMTFWIENLTMFPTSD